MKLLFKIFFWLVLCLFLAIMSAVIGDYWNWMLWQKGLLLISLVGAGLLIQWFWRRRRLKYHLKLLSISNASVFDIQKSWHKGLAQWCHEAQCTLKNCAQKPWYIGFSFEPLTALNKYPRVSLESNSHNVSVSLVAIDQTCILLFEFTSRLLLDREIELYKSYLQVFNKTFKKTLMGQLCFFEATTLENTNTQLLLDIANNFGTLNDAIIQITEKNLPITALLHRVENIPAYQDFWVRLAKNVKTEAFGWQANEFNFYEGDEWIDLKNNIWQQLLLHCEKAFIHQSAIGGIESYQFLSHIRTQLDQLKRLFQGDALPSFSLSGIYWLSDLGNLTSNQSSPFSQKVFAQYLPCAKIKAHWIPRATIAFKQRLKMSLVVYWSIMMSALVCVCLCYQTTSTVLLNQLEHFPKRVYFYHQPQADINSLLMYQNILVELNTDHQNHWLSLFPFRAGIDRLQRAYSLSYVNYFKRYALTPMDDLLLKNVTKAAIKNKTTRPLVIMSLMYRLNLIDTKLLHLPINSLKGPSVWQTTDDPDNLFPSLYKTYIENNNNIASLQQERDNLLYIAKQLNLEHEDFHWLLNFIDQQNPDDVIYLSQIWGGSKPIALANTQIAASYTLNGSHAVSDFWLNFNRAFAPITDFSKQQNTFYIWYQNSRYQQWHLFLQTFNKGYLTLGNQGEWDDTMSRIVTSNRGPYQFIFKLINDQFTDDITQQTSVIEPVWLSLGKQFHLVLGYNLQYKRTIGPSQIALTMSTLTNYAKQTKSSEDSKNTLESLYFDKIDFQKLAANDFYAYSQALKLLQNTVLQSEQAYMVSKAIYGGNNASFNDAMNKEISLEKKFIPLRTQTDVFWDIIKGPLSFYVRYSNLLSSNYLNNSWQLNVLAKTQNIPPMFLNNLLFGDNGIFWEYYNKYLGDYLVIRNNMVLPKFILNIPYPFATSFYTLINSAASSVSLAKQQTLYNQYFDKQAANNLPTGSSPAASTLPSIEALPPLLNAEATALPQQITLNVLCGKDRFVLTNYNFPIEKSLTMPLNNCQKTNLNITFSNFTLTKSYDNFLDFLEAIKNNTLPLVASDFPNDSTFLKQYHITSLTLNYQLNNFDGLIQQYQDYLNLQNTLKNSQRNYGSAEDLPAIIVATAEEGQASIREALSTSSTALWSKK